MKLIVITAETPLKGEAGLLNRLFADGMERLHIRKPGTPESGIRDLLRAVDPAWYGRIVLHDHFELAKAFNLRGVHLNARNPHSLPGTKTVSQSCHSLDELCSALDGEFEYLFLSPVFDSLSKRGYTAGFPGETLAAARNKGIINSRVVALGGISTATLPKAAEVGFGGAAVLGALWNNGNALPGQDFEHGLSARWNLLKTTAENL